MSELPELFTYSEDKMGLSYSAETPHGNNWRAFVLPDTVFQINASLVPYELAVDKMYKYFLMDQDDAEYAENELENCKTEKEYMEKNVELLRSLTHFVRKFPNKKIYLRSLAPARFGSTEDRRVFAEEFLEVLSLVLAKQNVPSTDASRIVQKCRAKFIKAAHSPNLVETVSMTVVLETLKKYKVDTSLFMMVHDPYAAITRNEISNRGRILTEISVNICERVANASRGALYVFQSLVIGINWTKREHNPYKQCILRLLQAWSNMNERHYGIASQMWQAANICKHQFGYESVSADNYYLKEYSIDVELPMSMYRNIVKKFDLPLYSNPMPDAKEDSIHAWMARFFLTLGWLQNLFAGVNLPQVKEFMLNSVLYMVPCHRHHWAAEEFLKSVLENKKLTKSLPIGSASGFLQGCSTHLEQQCAKMALTEPSEATEETSSQKHTVEKTEPLSEIAEISEENQKISNESQKSSVATSSEKNSVERTLFSSEDLKASEETQQTSDLVSEASEMKKEVADEEIPSFNCPKPSKGFNWSDWKTEDIFKTPEKTTLGTSASSSVLVFKASESTETSDAPPVSSESISSDLERLQIAHASKESEAADSENLLSFEPPNKTCGIASTNDVAVLKKLLEEKDKKIRELEITVAIQKEREEETNAVVKSLHDSNNKAKLEIEQLKEVVQQIQQLTSQIQK